MRRTLVALTLVLATALAVLRIRGMRSLPDGDGWRPLEGPEFR